MLSEWNGATTTNPWPLLPIIRELYWAGTGVKAWALTGGQGVGYQYWIPGADEGSNRESTLHEQ